LEANPARCTSHARARAHGRSSRGTTAVYSPEPLFIFFFLPSLPMLPAGPTYLLQPLAEFDKNTRLPNRLQSPEIRLDFVRIRDPYATETLPYILPHQPLSVFSKIANYKPRKARFPISPEHHRRARGRRFQHCSPALLCLIFLIAQPHPPLYFSHAGPRKQQTGTPELRRRRKSPAKNRRCSGRGGALKRTCTRSSHRAAPRHHLRRAGGRHISIPIRAQSPCPSGRRPSGKHRS
jgi:hypothetical protein